MTREFLSNCNELQFTKQKTLMITGGTGSFGNAVLNRFINSDIGEIRIFSRDEAKHDALRHRLQAEYPDTSEKVKFFIGDVRDIASVRNTIWSLYLDCR